MSNEKNSKYEIKSNEKLGRYIIARNDIKQGELILSENPIFLCPNWDSPVCCLNCFDDSKRICTDCQIFPLCNACKSHSSIECNFLKNASANKNIFQKNFNLILPLRCLLLTVDEENKKKFDRLMEMECHTKIRRGTERWETLQKKIVEPLLEIKIFDKFPIKVDEELLQKICGIFDVNSFEVRGPRELRGTVTDGFSLRGIYPNAALLPHNCVCNTFITVDMKFTLKMYASTDIRKGEIIFNNYTNPLFNTGDRQLFLKEGKYFECDCSRCADPLELQTNFSSIKCDTCDTGYYLPVYEGTKCLHFKCQMCINKIVEVDQINNILDNVRIKIEEIGDDIRQLEEANIRYSRLLHPNHSHVIEIKQLIAAMLRSLCYSIPPPLPISLLSRKVDLCREILSVLRIIQPGYSRLTGIAMYELYVPLVQMAKQEFELEKIDGIEFLKKLQEGENFLKQSIDMLMFESSDVPEGILARRAMIELSELRDAIKRVEADVNK